MLNSTVQTDVIIVGAGSTGLTLAVQLMRYNIDFVIFDKKEGVRLAIQGAGGSRSHAGNLRPGGSGEKMRFLDELNFSIFCTFRSPSLMQDTVQKRNQFIKASAVG